jgi:hypothetical protein
MLLFALSIKSTILECSICRVLRALPTSLLLLLLLLLLLPLLLSVRLPLLLLLLLLSVLLSLLLLLLLLLWLLGATGSKERAGSASQSCPSKTSLFVCLFLGW